MKWSEKFIVIINLGIEENEFNKNIKALDYAAPIIMMNEGGIVMIKNNE